ncbi:hypothetical protein RISK_006260 [Rhodopirellula islandica]|uniref:Mobile element protein n=1 Tax=Rhodopirellula islandica TaxID=595434 RepID=A0A0J1B5I3_RHOIS|nr:hypothetical protein RISK_006260 [Rhodopirellula islandica]
MQGRDTSKMNFDHFIGIEVAKAKLDISKAIDGPVLKVANEPSAIKAMIKELPRPKSALVVVEATGGHEKTLVIELVQAGHIVSVVNPKVFAIRSTWRPYWRCDSTRRSEPFPSV